MTDSQKTLTDDMEQVWIKHKGQCQRYKGHFDRDSFLLGLFMGICIGTAIAAIIATHHP